jgi:hypothetical protein
MWIVFKFYNIIKQNPPTWIRGGGLIAYPQNMDKKTFFVFFFNPSLIVM